uniref:Uncharacterized protein n=1 Tax=viral metagenome TaxID=1070528 RepID=A0A6C0BSQ4_9ZZZZ
MNIIEVLVPLFVFIILYPIFEKIYNMFGFGQDIGVIEGFTDKNYIDTLKKKGIALDDNDTRWINNNYKKLSLKKNSSKTDDIQRKKKTLNDITNKDIRQIKPNNNRQDLIFLKEHSVNDVKKLVNNIKILKKSIKEPFEQQEEKTTQETTETTETPSPVPAPATISKAEIISQENQKQISDIQKQIEEHSIRSDTRFASIESQMEQLASIEQKQSDIDTNLSEMKDKLKTNKTNISDIRQTLQGAPTVDYVNSKIGSIENEMTELRQKYIEMRKKYQSYNEN